MRKERFEPCSQTTVLLRSVPLNDSREYQEGSRRSRWMTAGVVLSVALIALSASGCSQYVTQGIPTSSSSANVNATSTGTPTSATGTPTSATGTPTSTTGTPTSTTAGPAGTPNAIPAATSVAQPSPVATSAPSSGPFQLVFDDEFNGTSINQNAWDLYSGTPGGNTATQWVPSMCKEENGMLVLPIAAQTAPDGRPLSACGMSGAKASTQIYGKYVYRARLDPGYDWYGMMLLWPNSQNWPTDGEIDDCEFGWGAQGLNDTGRTDCAMTVHWGANNTQAQAQVTGDFTQWHVFTLIWLPTSITYQIDGQTVWTETQHVPSDPMWVAFQTQGNGDASQLGAEDIDYLHIYRYTGG